ncbi:MAG TPA: hypothetical protein DEG65_13365 [Methylophaga sp.]|nr:hypothetical protein [Methylophaga sp.]
MALNLSVFDTVSQANSGAVLHLTVPGSGVPAYLDEGVKNPKKPLTITLLGLDSDEYTKYVQVKARARRKSNKKDDIDIEQSIQDACELYAKLTVGWEHIPDKEGNAMPFTFENAVNLYKSFKDIRVQVGNFIAEQENFIKS